MTRAALICVVAGTSINATIIRVRAGKARIIGEEVYVR